MESKISKILLIIILLAVFVFCFWFFTGRVFLADYYYRKTRETQDWPKVLENYQKTFSLFSQEPFYYQKLAKDLKWGLKFYQNPDIKIQIIDLAINQMEKIREKESSYNTKIYLAELYLLKSELTQKQEDFLKTEEALQVAVKMSPQIAKTYINWCQLKIYQKEWDQAEKMCQKAFDFYPPLNHPQLTKYHKGLILGEISQIYEKLGDISLKQKKYKEAVHFYQDALESFPLGEASLWKKLGDAYYLQGDLDTAIAKNLHGHVLEPQSSFWCSTLALLYKEKGNQEKFIYWLEKGLQLDPENKSLLEIKETIEE